MRQLFNHALVHVQISHLAQLVQVMEIVFGVIIFLIVLMEISILPISHMENVLLIHMDILAQYLAKLTLTVHLV